MSASLPDKYGLLVGGKIIPIPGVVIHNQISDPDWCRLDPGDYTMRHTGWVRQLVVHTTKGDWPQMILAGAGAVARAELVAAFWRGDPTHSAAQLVIGSDGTVACLCDLLLKAAYHATTANDYSVGVEVYQEQKGVIRQAAIDALCKIAPVIARALGFPFQVHSRPYRQGRIVERLLHGGPDVVGVYGHRDQAWDFVHNTSSRGQGDPGDGIMSALVDVAGGEPVDFQAQTDLIAWKRRQAFMLDAGQLLTVNGQAGPGGKMVDGVAGPGTMAAMARMGFATGRDLDVHVLEQPASMPV